MDLPKSFSMKVAGGKTVQIPSVGFGTFAAEDPKWAKDATLAALKAGYRHIDSAWYYNVDEPVGAAIKESGIPREEIFYTSKAWPHFLAPENVELCLDQVLEATGLEYVDLFLAHWPVAWKVASREGLSEPNTHKVPRKPSGVALGSNEKPMVDWEHTSAPIAQKGGHQGSFVATWQAMEGLVRKGKAKAIGLSNFSIADIEDLLPHVRDIPISCNQIEVHPWLPQKELVAFGKEHDIVTSAWSPFAGQKVGGPPLQDPTIVELAKKNEMDAGQLLQSWAVQRGTVPLGKSSTPKRIQSNLNVRRISEADMEAIDGLALPNGEGRTVTRESMKKAMGVEFY